MSEDVLLRARGLKVSVDRIRDALQCGAVPGRRDDRRRHRWMLTPEDVDVVERYFRDGRGLAMGGGTPEVMRNVLGAQVLGVSGSQRRK